jgi:FKBP-type peptidyl-prolyl cis-trans isomerase
VKRALLVLAVFVAGACAAGGAQGPVVTAPATLSIGSASSSDVPIVEEVPPEPADAQAPPRHDDGLVIEDLALGTGQEARSGDTVVVEYTGTTRDGTEFDSTAKRGPATFRIGVGQLIKGWDQGLPGMRVGGRRRLVIPPELAYGDRGIPPNVPPRSTLVFEVQLLDVKRPNAGP